MSKLGDIIHKYNLDDDDLQRLEEHIRGASSEEAGIKSWIKSMQSDIEEIRSQLQTQGHKVNTIHKSSPYISHLDATVLRKQNNPPPPVES